MIVESNVCYFSRNDNYGLTITVYNRPKDNQRLEISLQYIDVVSLYKRYINDHKLEHPSFFVPNVTVQYIVEHDHLGYHQHKVLTQNTLHYDSETNTFRINYIDLADETMTLTINKDDTKQVIENCASTIIEYAIGDENYPSSNVAYK